MSDKLNIQDPVVRKILIGGKEKGILTFGIQPSEEVSLTSDSMHHIHILDRSGSMGWTINELMDDVKKTLRMIDKEDYVTVIWFSGAGQYRTVVKCAKNDPTSIDKILDSLKSTVGCTCFSDPIKELDEIIRETSPMCDVFNVTIFTDGDTVTPWSVAEETKRIFENLDVIKNKVVAFNTVGYGNYYNRDLLLKMSKTTEYGQLTHASKIDEYSKIFSHNRDIVADLIGKRITVMSPDSEIVTLSARSTKLGEEKAVIRLGKTRNEFCIIFDASKNWVSYTINGEAFSMSLEDVDVCTLDEYEDMDPRIMYAYAYNLYYEGRRKDALNVLNALGDPVLMESQCNAFTVSEVGEYTKLLRKTVFSNKLGEVNAFRVAPNSYMPDPNAYCILDLLRDLVDADARYMPTNDYQRIGRKVVDEFNCFERDENQDAVSMSGIVLSQDRLNISLRFEIKGKVKLNPKRAKSVGLPEVIEGCRIYRTHTIVQDGGLNINSLTVLVPKESSLTFLRSSSFVANVDKTSVDGYNEVIIDLTKLPVINQSYLTNTTAESLLKIERQMLEIEAQNKVLKTFIKDDISDFKEDSQYTVEQVMVLIEHGLNALKTYSSLAPKTQEAEDFNVVKEFRTCLKGFSTLPSINAVEKKLKENKKLTNPEALLNKYMSWASSTTGCADLKAILRNNKKTLNELRFSLSGSKLALVLTGEWLPELELQEDGSYIYSDGNDTLVVKLERKEIPV